MFAGAHLLFLWGFEIVHRWWQVDHWWWWSFSSGDFGGIEDVRDILVFQFLVDFALELGPFLFVSAFVDKIGHGINCSSGA